MVEIRCPTTIPNLPSNVRVDGLAICASDKLGMCGCCTAHACHILSPFVTDGVCQLKCNDPDDTPVGNPSYVCQADGTWSGSFSCTCNPNSAWPHLLLAHHLSRALAIGACASSPCDPLTTCSNSTDGFACSDCPEGYLTLQRGRTCQGKRQDLLWWAVTRADK